MTGTSAAWLAGGFWIVLWAVAAIAYCAGSTLRPWQDRAQVLVVIDAAHQDPTAKQAARELQRMEMAWLVVMLIASALGVAFLLWLTVWVLGL